MKRTLAAWILVTSATAFAQTVSDLMPTPEPAAPGRNSMYIPGMPLPSSSAAPETLTGTLLDAPPKEKKGFNIGYDDGFNTSNDYSRDDTEVSAPVDRNAELHVVKKNDTLWSVAGSYLGSPWHWPKLWALNPSITNPHWIFPGDVLRLRAGDPAVATPTPDQPKRESKLTSTPRAQTVTGFFLRQTGFIEPNELETSGKIIASKEEKLMLATDDEAYVEYKKGSTPKVGERLSIYRPDRVMRHPTSGKKLGYVVQIYSDAEVISVTSGKIARIKLRDSMDPSERGYRVGPLRRQFKIVESKRDGSPIEGVIIDTLQLAAGLVGTDMLIFLDRGRKNGLDVGNRLLITRRGDGYVPILSKGPIDNKTFPRETIGEILIVDVRDALSTGIVTKSVKEARVGDRVETRTGP